MSRQSRTIWLAVLVMTLGLNACVAAKAKTLSTPTLTPTLRATVTTIPLPTPTPTLAVPASACPLPDLPEGLHLSASGSYTQTEVEAAGPMLCRIERNTCPFYQLVGNLDSTIVFKHEEEPPFDEEDILVHPAALLPLSRLNELVQTEWNRAYHLRLTDAYDSLLEHDLGQTDLTRKYSLHFEGRALDLTTWPIDPSRYGRLCALAHCAGFAWVHHEGDHCHVAVNAPSLCLRCAN
ncbi:MAG: hypothetical protein KJ077_20125 [Anaerolineae bacterium]|nr:hypothetical protein [Anaerolineae bacterium]